MKRLKYFLLLLLTAVAFAIPALPVRAAEPNLIANPSVETASGTNPASWTSNKWGTNTTTFQYKAEGHTGTKSLYINTTAYTNGDAKWMPAAVTVKPSTSYTYSTWYKASAATELDLMYTDASGNVTYAYAGSYNAATAWTSASNTFTTPANAVKVTPLHILAMKGNLQTDDMSLVENTTTTPPVDPPTTPPTPPVDSDNLILNPSMDTANGAAPANWTSNKWGTNTAAFTYDTTGRTGRSVTAKITAYTNGDAKWLADASSVVAGKPYLYRDYYKSNVVTRVVIAYQNAAGAYTYAEQATAPASASAWAQYSTTFTVPTGIVKATVYHLIDKVGTLSLDDTVLTVATPASPTAIANPSLETANGAVPADWTSSSWGTNSPTYQYVNEGHTGTKSVKVTMANYTDGDAKWYFNPITTLTPGKQYRLTNWYKTNVTPHAVAMFIMADGTEQYFGMPNPEPAANSATTWTKYSDTFTVPAGAVSVSTFFYIAENGFIQTDDYSLSDYVPTGFANPLLTLTFDDGAEENVTNALPLLNQYGFKSTQCYATTFVEGNQTMINNVKAFYNAGHEICSHTVTHPFLTQVTPTQLTYETQHSQQFLQSVTGTPIKNFASPYGDYNQAVNTELKKYYRSHRTVDEGYNSKDNFDAYRIRVQNILDTTPASQVKAWVDQAKADKTWLVLVYHRVATDPGPYDTTPTLFKAHLDAIKASGISVKTYNAALDEVTVQL